MNKLLELYEPDLEGFALRGADAKAPVPMISTPNLTDTESAELLACINRVRAGDNVFMVRCTNKKVTNGPKRVPGVDYKADPGLALHAHEGLLVAAPLNKQGNVYLHILDEARARDGEPFGHTRITMDGILSFKVLSMHPGPAVEPKPSPEKQSKMAQAVVLQAAAIEAQASVTESAALQAQAQALKLQAEQLAKSLK